MELLPNPRNKKGVHARSSASSQRAKLGILLVKQICHPIIHKAKPHSRMHANVKRQHQSKKQKDIVARGFILCKDIILQPTPTCLKIKGWVVVVVVKEIILQQLDGI
jgi:hypothetical protein